MSYSLGNMTKLIIGGVDISEYVFLENINFNQDTDLIDISTIGGAERKFARGPTITTLELTMKVNKVLVGEDGSIIIGEEAAKVDKKDFKKKLSTAKEMDMRDLIF